MSMDVPHAEEKVAILACTPFEPFLGSRHIFLQSPVTDGGFGAWSARRRPPRSRAGRP